MNEQIPDRFTLDFVPISDGRVRVLFNGDQVGNTLSDNSFETDYYRYHDVFHFTNATILGWSPCVRALLNCKRKTNPMIDEVEDGARARSIEEGISAIIFEDARKNDFYKNGMISDEKLEVILSSTQRLEVGNQTLTKWKEAISKSFAAFRYLVKNSGGKIRFDARKGEICPI